MLRHVFLAVAMVVVGLARSEAAPPPNFVVILADDLGYGEVGARHIGDVATPNIDAIARAGVTFTDGYVTANLCSPSRAGLLTGRYQQEFGFYGNPGKPPYPSKFGLPAAQVTLAEALKVRGYATGIVGKWHLGVKPADNPLNHGFDEFFGVMDTDHPYFGEMRGNPILRGTTPVAASGYLTDTLGAEAVSYIKRHSGQRFFLYVPFTAAHSPYQAKPEILARLGHIGNAKRRVFAAILVSLDEAVGKITAALRAAGVAGNTVVVFLGDNGCGGCRNTPLRGGKGTNYEGGIRVPFLLSWPGRLQAGRSYAQPVIATDLFATFLTAAGGTPAGVVDGVDLVPYLNGSRPGAPHTYLFWGSKATGAVRSGDWKLVNNELYNLRSEINERTNVAGAHADVVSRLRAARASWARGLAPALW